MLVIQARGSEVTFLDISQVAAILFAVSKTPELGAVRK
jgi:hypothetical protein